ncbi:hypothetical protein PVK06_041306 [Gossypium arboreum]|uniref:Uncharacterized protein n=1 Tax=Gossypium arboreum TaxID=29729 RepID=A0ABR0N873_GOSAR|nr:hypothetical protein PVK06_041306 [Gossypium arboreum]
MAHESSPIPTHSNPPSSCISPLCLPLAEELPIKESGELALIHHNLSSRELKGIVERWKRAVKRKICAGDSSGSSQKSALLTLNSSLQTFLAKASAISLGLKENIVGEFTEKLGAEQVKIDELSSEVVALGVELRKVFKEHKPTVNCIKLLAVALRLTDSNIAASKKVKASLSFQL